MSRFAKLARRCLGDVVAGVLTAIVFYAEYISLGATLGGHIAGVGKDAAPAVGSLLVLGAVWMSCLSALLWFLPKPLLAGPRAASVLILIVGLNWVKGHVTNPLVLPTAGMLAMGLMLCVAAAVQLLGLLEYVRNRVKAMPPAISKGFLFMTAVSVVMGAVDKQLGGCLQFSFWPTAAIFLVSVGVACRWASWSAAQTDWRISLKALSLPIGMALAWAGYTLFLPGASSAASCGTLGALGLQLQTLTDRIPDVVQAQAAFQGMGMLDWAAVAAIGAVMGLVQLIETLTTLDSIASTRDAPHLWRRYTAATALANLLSAPVGLACSSWSAARSSAVARSFGTGRFVVLIHTLTLILIASLATNYIAKLPLLALAVALTMVAVQMVDVDTEEKVWKPGYAPSGAPANTHAVWLFWWVIGVGFVTGTAIYGLLAGAVLAGLMAWYARFCAKNNRTTVHA
jgi:MFS superfamily sulfate permease-like transporter